MVDYAPIRVDQRETMPSTPSSISGDRFSKGMLLLAVLFFSWLLSAKNLMLEWVSPAKDTLTPTMPNILMIVADDLGYDDTNAINNGGLHTPNLQGLAQEGVTFRRHYADSTCTPSRVAILTGRYPERSGFRPVGSEIPAEFATIAQELSDAGYATYLTGKWHVGEDRPQAWPENKGFDQWFGFLNQWELSGEVTELNKGKRKPTYHNPQLRENGGELRGYSGHLTDILTDHTVRKIEQLRSANKPWFIYHAFLAPHHPIQPAERYASQFPQTPAGRYTALVTQLDDAIGRILSAVDRTNTLVVFVSDNGGTNVERNNNFPFFGKKGELFEGSFRTPLIVSWPGIIPEGKTIDDVVMNVDIFPTLLAAAHREAPADLDGVNLWPAMLGEHTVEKRARSWEIYSPNVNSVNFSQLSTSGEWRLTSLQGSGIPPGLYHLATNGSGEEDVAAVHEDVVENLTSEFWQDHWEKSLIPVIEQPGGEDGQTLYLGFDTMRTPYRYGFSIGLSIGPLPSSLDTSPQSGGYILAGQDDTWELRYNPGLGLEWQLGDTVLTDPHFEPSRCNAIVVTGYIQPKGHLTKRDPRSEIKLYSSGFLRDASYDPTLPADNEDSLHAPTFVNFNGRAKFSNMILSSFADSYSPNIRPQFSEFYVTLFQEKKLSLANVSMMNAELCRDN